MQLTINIPDSVAPRVVDALSELHGWTPTLPDGSPNPQTRAQAAKQRVIETIKGDVRASESRRIVVSDLDLT